MAEVIALDVDNPKPRLARIKYMMLPSADSIYPERRAGGFTRFDGTIQFYVRVQALLDGATTVVDLGSGRGAQHERDAVAIRRKLLDLREPNRRVLALDVDSVVLEHTHSDEQLVIEADDVWPLEDASVDVIVSDWVLEHVAHPTHFGREVARVLRPGGWFCARTPNKWGLTGIGARLVPNTLHVRFLSFLQPDRYEIDVFPTTYLLNTRSDLLRAFGSELFHDFTYGWSAEPAYTTRVPILHRLLAKILPRLPEPVANTWMIFKQRTHEPLW